MIDPRIVNSQRLVFVAMTLNNGDKTNAMVQLLGAMCMIAFDDNTTEESKKEFALVIAKQIVEFPTPNEAIM